MKIVLFVSLVLYYFCGMISSLIVLRNSFGVGSVYRRKKSTTSNFFDRSNDTPHLYTSTSFFRFIDIAQKDIDSIASSTKKILQDLEVKGTVLLSTEGYNAQLAVPALALQHLLHGLESSNSTIFKDIDINIGPTIDYSLPNSALFPFKRLVVREKKSILTDGLNAPLDWNLAGPEMPADQWHNAVSSTDIDKAPIVLDCRNKYESSIGAFQGATPLNTTNFSETWSALEEALRDTPRDAPVLTYCTGGIRCVKVNAFLLQRMGFTNTHRLQGGIIAYERWLREINSVNNPVNSSYNHSIGVGRGTCRTKACAHINYDTELPQIQQQQQQQEYENNEDNKVESTGIRGRIKSVFWGENFVFDRRRLGQENYSSPLPAP